MEIAALVSGGVDSSVVVHQLVESGYKPTIFYIRIGMEDETGYMGCSAEEDIEITSFIAQKYGLKMEVVSLQEEYWNTVVAYTLRTVKEGLTPNPDVMCNRLIKFGAFIDKWGKDFDKVATGHYAQNIFEGGKYWLGTATDRVKDQTDFLAQISYEQLSKILFPIGALPKSEVRAIAERAALPSAKRKDSQGICFLGKINYNDFIRKYLGEKQGKIVELETGKVLGTHNGFWFHTIGQRKGLGLSGGPWYVVGKSAAENVVFVSQGYDTEKQYGNVIPLEGIHYITECPWAEIPESGVEITFKIRHTPEFTRGTLLRCGEGYKIKSESMIQGIAPGQYGVIYTPDSRICLGSGVISLLQ
ncbi:MAG: tRNA 2-thiouridine(34) synthase MnmA [Paludibacteraceae bacterium]|nr:tRNA 2-thiouridine(34) synthase MnmA [Paludibacteraceae bacterium]MBQ2065263.1 tRNA 2-thiouridine(34) synthase MnmA [Paludibacteraceae bacterium]